MEWSRGRVRGDIEAIKDRYRGVLVASATGDALGATVEFMSPTDIRAELGVHREVVGGGWLNLAPGEVTDDTQMAMCIARSIVETDRFEPDDIAARFVEWFKSDPKDIGNTTRHALRQLAGGVGWREAGETTHREMRPRDASNGSLMRIAPVPLIAPYDLDSTLRFAADSSRITHANPLCIDACRAAAAAIAALVLDPAADPLEAARGGAESDDVQAAIERAPIARVKDLAAGGYVLDTLEAAFWSVVRHDSLEDAIVAAVNLGNDADTTGAVAGAIAGARWGMTAIPERWLTVLRDLDELVRLADGLCAIAFPGEASVLGARHPAD